jgi:predicted dehydrogenase
MTTHRTTRRTFITHAATAGLALPTAMPKLVRAASSNGKVHHATVGCSGMPWNDVRNIARGDHVKIVAACDVDKRQFDGVKKNFPDAKLYTDWREMLAREDENLDSVNVGTPDHMHAPITVSALRRGKHVYCQKPLTHNVHECRRVTEEAREAGTVTQMGIQVHSRTEYRLAVRLLRDGAIGKVKESHSFSGKSWGGGTRPYGKDPVPDPLHWEGWLGVAPWRPYLKDVYHRRKWRRWQDFGTGNLGDMACHIFDPVFNGLELTAPVDVRSEGPEPFTETWPNTYTAHFTFPGTKHTGGDTVSLSWYDGGAKPPKRIRKLLGDMDLPRQGSIVVGTEGTMLIPHVGGPRLLPQKKFQKYEYPDLPPDNHWDQYVAACRGEGETSASFDYSGPLAETVLVGTIASRFKGQTLKWDAKNLKFTNASEPNRHVKEEYRDGWKVEGLG